MAYAAYTINDISYSTCDCSGSKVFVLPHQCTSCGGGCGQTCEKMQAVMDEQDQQRIWKTVRLDSSVYTMSLGVQNVKGGINNKPKPHYFGVNWNQMSDRAVPGVQTAYVPRSRTGHRPGGAGAAGPLANGVDVKHGSYARYLARKKGLETRSKKATPLPAPLQGNKNYLLGLIPGCGC